MDRAYLVLVDGKLAGRRLTQLGAKKLTKELQERGYRNVSYAYEIGKETL